MSTENILSIKNIAQRGIGNVGGVISQADKKLFFGECVGASNFEGSFCTPRGKARVKQNPIGPVRETLTDKYNTLM